MRSCHTRLALTPEYGPGFARAVDSAVAARVRTYGEVKTVSEQALTERLKRVNEMYELGRIGPEEYTAKCREIDEQRSRMSARPAPLFTQQQQVLTTARGRVGRDDGRREEADARGHL